MQKALMIRQILTFVFTAHLFFVSALAQAKTYRELVLDPESNIVQEKLGAACIKELKAFFESGGDLSNDALINASSKVKDTPFKSGRYDNIFYHYTKSEKLNQISERNLIAEQFDFIIKNRLHYWYVAEDPISSQSFGKYLVRITLDPDSFVLSKADSNFDRKIKYMFRKKKIKKCGLRRSNFSDNNYFIKNLVFEENGIALINYYGENEWFQLISEKFVLKIEPGVKKEW